MIQKTLDEIKDLLHGNLYKYCSLKNMNDKILVTQNKRGEYLTNGQNIIDQLNSDLIPNGAYKVCLKTTTNQDPFEFMYTKGKVNLSEEMAPINPITLNIPPDFSQAVEHPAVKLQSEIARLKIENENLYNEVEELTKQLEELENELKEKATLSEEAIANNKFETARTFFGEIVQVGVPLLDKYFQQKDQQIEIERARLNMSRPTPPVQTGPTPQQVVEKKVIAWINSKSEDQELFDNLQALYYNSANIQKFGELLKDFNTELYEECRQAI
jgi:hypothetical protein